MYIKFYLLKDNVVLAPYNSGQHILFQPVDGSLQGAFERAGLVLDNQRLQSSSQISEYLLEPEEAARAEKIADNNGTPLTWAKKIPKKKTIPKKWSNSEKAGLLALGSAGIGAGIGAGLTYLKMKKNRREEKPYSPDQENDLFNFTQHELAALQAGELPSDPRLHEFQHNNAWLANFWAEHRVAETLASQNAKERRRKKDAEVGQQKKQS